MADTPPETTPGTPNEAPEVKNEITEDVLKRMIQSEVDRVRTDYSKKLKATEAELTALRQEKLTAEQLKEIERKQLEERLLQKEKELTDKEVSIKARDLLTQEGLALSFVDYVKGDTIEATEKRVKALKAEWQKALAGAVDSAIKSHGRDPAKERDGSAGSSEIAGMTPEQIKAKAASDPAWWAKNEKEILALMAAGKLKK